MKECPSCGVLNPATAEFCKVCKIPLRHRASKTEVADIKDFTVEPGDYITPKYRVIRLLGEGGMGSVYLVEEVALQKEYALKLISPRHVANQEARLRFMQEVAICRELYHPDIIRVFDFGTFELKPDELYYFTMEYLQGHTLGELLRSREGSLPPFTPAEIRQVMTPLLEALAYAHRFTVHRDIKPDNIMVKGEFPDVEIRILDFGIARTMSASRFTVTSQDLGTAMYIAPEQMKEAHEVDQRADIYSATVVLYEMLTNSNSPGFDLPSDLLSPAYAPLDRIVKKGYAKDPSRRYPDAPSMLAELEAALDETEQALPASEQKKERERRERRRKEEEERKQREKRLKIAPLQANLEDAVARGKWRRAAELCAEIQAMDPDNSLVAKKQGLIEEELTRQRQKEEQQRKTAEEEAKRKREQEKKIADLRDRLTDAVTGRQWKKARSICKTIISLDSSQNEIRQHLGKIEEELARQAEEEKKKKEQEEERSRQEEEKLKEKRVAEEQIQVEDILISQEQSEQQSQTEISVPPGRQWISVGIAAVVLMVAGMAYFALRPGGEVKPPGGGNNQQEVSRRYNSPGDDRLAGEQASEEPRKRNEQQGKDSVAGSLPASTYTDPTTGMEFVFVKGGCYQMGCGSWTSDCNDDEKPVHEVCVDGFYMDRYEVTQGQWQKVMGSNSSYFKKGDNYPVENVSWNDAQEFIRELNSKSGKTYRLPTEAEWEYAARSGGRQEEYAGGNDVDAVAWNDNNSGGSTHPVGRKQPNGLGLYDMTGNVWEWCSDWHDWDYYKSSPRRNPQGSSSGSFRVLRGGSWDYGPRLVRAAFRGRFEPGIRCSKLGFRLAFSEDSSR